LTPDFRGGIVRGLLRGSRKGTMMRKHARTVGAPTVAMAAIFAVFFGSLVMAGPEMEQPGASWPGEVDAQGAPALTRLREIHEMAIVALPDATPEDRPNIERVLRASFECAAYDGAAPIAEPPPEILPAHAPGHAGAAAKVHAAWEALHHEPSPPEKPDPWKDWATCADELEHGHE
jgi:hypothetical protein